MSKIAIFGATSAIAAACARQWLAQGHHVFLIGRDALKLSVVTQDLIVRRSPDQIVGSASADLGDYSRHAGLIAEARQAMGGLDVVLVAHGSLPDQKACEASVDRTLEEMRTNALSVVSVVSLVANDFEAQGRGTIAVIGSVAGDRGRQSNYVYGAAKGMVTIFLAGLRNRLAKKGVTVLTIKPGFVDTPMTAHIQNKGKLWAKPDDVARGIVKAVASKKDVVYLPGIWRLIMLIIRHIPESIFKRLSL